MIRITYLPFDQCKYVNLEIENASANVIIASSFQYLFSKNIDCKDEKSCKTRNCCAIEKSVFDRCRLCSGKDTKRKSLFASNYTVSEYNDNIGRVARMILDLNIHCHSKCTKRNCSHPFVMDLSKPPKHKSKFTEIPCGIECAKHETKKPHQRSHDKCTNERFGVKKQSWDKN